MFLSMTSTSTQAIFDLLDAHKQSSNLLHVQSAAVLSFRIREGQSDGKRPPSSGSMRVVAGRCLDFILAAAESGCCVNSGVVGILCLESYGK